MTGLSAAGPHQRRVLQIVYSLAPGGAENIVASLAIRLTAGRYPTEVAALTDTGKVADRLTAAGIPVHVIGKRPGFDHGAGRRLARLLRERNYALVHTHNPPPNLWAVLARPFARSPIVLTLHAPAGAMGGRFKHAVRNLVCWRNAVILGVSEMVTESFRRRDPLNRHRYRTLYNGIEPLPRGTPAERERLWAELALPEGAVVAGTVGNLRPPKAHADLFEALAQLKQAQPRLRTLIAGEGPLRGMLTERLTALGLEDRVQLLGNRSDVGALLASMDLFVLSSRSEGLPLALLEAVAAEVPVVSTQVGGIAEVIADGVRGTLVPPADPAALAAAMAARLADPEGTRSMAQAARRHFDEHFTADRMLARHVALYDELLDSRP